MITKRHFITMAAVLITTIGLGTTAFAVTKTGSDVSALTTTESNMVSVLRHFQNTPAWVASFKAAEAKQAADLARVNSDLTPPSSHAEIYALTGSGMETTPAFTVPASAKGWHVNWSYNCASFGGKGNFDFEVYQGTQLNFNDNGPNQLGAKGSGVQHFYDTGTFHLEMASECDWSVQVYPGSS